jgi:hypothetical protein
VTCSDWKLTLSLKAFAIQIGLIIKLFLIEGGVWLFLHDLPISSLIILHGVLDLFLNEDIMF